MDNIGNEISKEEKEKLLNEKMEAIRRKNEELKRRHEEVQADKKLADKYSASVQISEAKPYVMKPPRLRPEKAYNLASSGGHIDGDAQSPSGATQDFLLSRQRLGETDGPPPDPCYRFLADPDRDNPSHGGPPRERGASDKRGGRGRGRGRGRGARGEVETEEFGASSVHARGRGRGRGRWGGGGPRDDFEGSSSWPEEEQEQELRPRGRGDPGRRPGRRGRGGQQQRGRRRAYEEWKAERDAIDEARLTRARSGDGEWRREWDLQKTEQTIEDPQPIYDPRYPPSKDTFKLLDAIPDAELKKLDLVSHSNEAPQATRSKAVARVKKHDRRKQDAPLIFAATCNTTDGEIVLNERGNKLMGSEAPKRSAHNWRELEDPGGRGATGTFAASDYFESRQERYRKMNVGSEKPGSSPADEPGRAQDVAIHRQGYAAEECGEVNAVKTVEEFPKESNKQSPNNLINEKVSVEMSRAKNENVDLSKNMAQFHTFNISDSQPSRVVCSPDKRHESGKLLVEGALISEISSLHDPEVIGLSESHLCSSNSSSQICEQISSVSAIEGQVQAAKKNAIDDSSIATILQADILNICERLPLSSETEHGSLSEVLSEDEKSTHDVKCEDAKDVPSENTRVNASPGGIQSQQGTNASAPVAESVLDPSDVQLTTDNGLHHIHEENGHLQQALVATSPHNRDEESFEDVNGRQRVADLPPTLMQGSDQSEVPERSSSELVKKDLATDYKDVKEEILNNSSFPCDHPLAGQNTQLPSTHDSHSHRYVCDASYKEDSVYEESVRLQEENRTRSPDEKYPGSCLDMKVRLSDGCPSEPLPSFQMQSSNSKDSFISVENAENDKVAAFVTSSLSCDHPPSEENISLLSLQDTHSLRLLCDISYKEDSGIVYEESGRLQEEPGTKYPSDKEPGSCVDVKERLVEETDEQQLGVVHEQLPFFERQSSTTKDSLIPVEDVANDKVVALGAPSLPRDQHLDAENNTRVDSPDDTVSKAADKTTEPLGISPKPMNLSSPSQATPSKLNSPTKVTHGSKRVVVSVSPLISTKPSVGKPLGSVSGRTGTTSSTSGVTKLSPNKTVKSVSSTSRGLVASKVTPTVAKTPLVSRIKPASLTPSAGSSSAASAKGRALILTKPSAAKSPTGVQIKASSPLKSPPKILTDQKSTQDAAAKGKLVTVENMTPIKSGSTPSQGAKKATQPVTRSPESTQPSFDCAVGKAEVAQPLSPAN